MTPRQRFVLTLEVGTADTFGRSPVQRLRAALKVLRRRFSLRCISVTRVGVPSAVSPLSRRTREPSSRRTTRKGNSKVEH